MSTTELTTATVIVVALILTAGVLAWVIWRVKERWFGHYGFRKKQLLTPNELDFYRRLTTALSPGYTVLPQVAMGAIVDTTLKPNHSKYWQARGKFSQKICDFVICNTATLEPLLLVELDDVMHDFDKDKERDAVTTLAGFRTLRFWSRKKPSPEQIRGLVLKELALSSSLSILDKTLKNA